MIVSSFVVSEGIHLHFLSELHCSDCWRSDPAFASFPWLDEGTSISGRRPGLVKLQMLVSVIPCICALETWLALKFLSWELGHSQEKHTEDGPMWLSQLLINTPHNDWREMFLQSSASCISGYQTQQNQVLGSCDIQVFQMLFIHIKAVLLECIKLLSGRVLEEIQSMTVSSAWLTWEVFRSVYTTPLGSDPLVLNRSRCSHARLQASYSSVSRSI